MSPNRDMLQLDRSHQIRSQCPVMLWLNKLNSFFLESLRQTFEAALQTGFIEKPFHGICENAISVHLPYLKYVLIEKAGDLMCCLSVCLLLARPPNGKEPNL